MNKVLFYDTCALLDAQKEAFETDAKFYLSSITINELENIKTSGVKDEETKYNARTLLHLLEQHENKYEIILYKNAYMEEVSEFDLPNTPDSKIIATAYHFFKTIEDEGLFLTKDLACKAIAYSIGLNVDLQKQKEEDYTGYLEKTFSDDELADFYSNKLSQNENIYNLLDNQYLIMRDTNNNVIDKYKWHENKYMQIQFQKAESRMFGKVVPKNGDIYQQLALDSLANNQISMLRGPAGSGKSYLAFGHMFSLLERGRIDKIVIFCNTVATKGSAKLGLKIG